MSNNDELAKEFVKVLVPTFDKMEFRASISDTSRSVEFFVWVNDEKLQCYELADTGKIDESQMEKMFDSFAEAIRKSDEYKSGEVNKIKFTC
ncbi:MAG: hypothetical protein FWG63_10150 [Defluviitaleaceae bacterium]|nr:hypothetical protein [Defluviitaleaceae bacterium]